MRRRKRADALNRIQESVGMLCISTARLTAVDAVLTPFAPFDKFASSRAFLGGHVVARKATEFDLVRKKVSR